MNVLLLCDPSQSRFASQIASCFEEHTYFTLPKKLNYLSDILLAMKVLKEKRGITIHAVACSSITVLHLLVKRDFKSSTAKQEAEKILHLYEGALFNLPGTKTFGEGKNFPIVMLPDLKSVYTKPHGKFLISRYLKKLFDSKFPASPKLLYDVANTQDYEANEKLIKEIDNSLLISIDIETHLDQYPVEYANVVAHDGVNLYGLGYIGKGQTKSGGKTAGKFFLVPRITCVGYSYLFKDDAGNLTSRTLVVPMDSMEAVSLVRRLNATRPPKTLQNGRYDMMYFLRYAAPVYNWKFDTYIMFHSWYAELPRSLYSISAFTTRNHMYWKDESGENLYGYNAKDCHATLWAAVFILSEWPDWAKENYNQNFKQIFPAIQCAVEGFKADEEEHLKVKASYEEAYTKAVRRLEILTNTPGINANSSQQITKLMKAMGFSTASSDKKAMIKFRDTISYWDVLGEAIVAVREAKKAISTYMNIPYFCGRLLYELDPAGTDTGRYASKASSFWCGTQIQNIPLYARSMYVADKGKHIGAVDNSQSESRCTAYISEDENLMSTVEDDKDFHKVNASLFFGIPFEEITKAIRTVAKRVNHGANYNMGPAVLLETMGSRAVLNAKMMLGLPIKMALIDVCKYLLSRFDAAYPRVRKEYYEEVTKEIEQTSMLLGATGWTRYCFGHPNNSKMQLNSYVAHPPQSLSVKIINESFFDAWYELQFKKKLARFKAQVHDEIIVQYDPENTKVVIGRISELMRRPVKIKGREMIIPNDPKFGVHRWSEVKD